MRLRAYDTVHVSSVKAENLRPGEEFEIGDAAAEELMRAHPGLFAVVLRSAEAKAEPAAENKAEPAPENKATAAVSPNRSVPRRR